MTPTTSHGSRSSFLALLALAALALAGAGGSLLVKAEVDAARAEAEASACRAREEGLSELSCMDFSGVDRFFLTLWGSCLLAAGVGAGLALAWLASRPDPLALRIATTIAALVATMSAGMMLVGGAIWTPVAIAVSGLGALAAALAVSLMMEPSPASLERSTGL